MEYKEQSLFDDHFFNKPMTVAVRLKSMLLDHVILCFIIVPIIIAMRMIESSKSTSEIHLTGVDYYVMLSLFGIYFSKDCIAGRSIAKRILNLQVVNNQTEEVATPIQCLIRNILDILWPIEVLITLFNPERRLGDILAGTKVAYFNLKKEKESINFFQVVLSIILAMLVSIALGMILSHI